MFWLRASNTSASVGLFICSEGLLLLFLLQLLLFMVKPRGLHQCFKAALARAPDHPKGDIQFCLIALCVIGKKGVRTVIRGVL